MIRTSLFTKMPAGMLMMHTTGFLRDYVDFRNMLPEQNQTGTVLQQILQITISN